VKTCAVLTPRLGQSLVPIMARLQSLSGSNPENCAETFSFRITWVRGGDWRQKQTPNQNSCAGIDCPRPGLHASWITSLSQRKLSASLSSLDGSGRRDANPMESHLERLGRRDWWLWLSTLVVTILSGTVFLLSSFPSLFLHSDRFFEIGSDQARWAILGLLLLFNTWLVYRQWSFRRLRAQLTGLAGDAQSNLEGVYDPSRMDPITGLYTRASVEQLLGKEVARARRQNTPLSLVALHLDDFAQLNQRYGSAVGDLILKEFANRLRKASRGNDVGVRLGSDDFLLVLSECSLSDARIASDRLGSLEMKCSGHDIALTYSVGWIDYKPGEVPSDMFKRAGDVLELYKKASKDSFSTTLVVR
jgi:diguanylate cyclase (GGDEF)-like protein